MVYIRASYGVVRKQTTDANRPTNSKNYMNEQSIILALSDNWADSKTA